VFWFSQHCYVREIQSLDSSSLQASKHWKFHLVTASCNNNDFMISDESDCEAQHAHVVGRDRFLWVPIRIHHGIYKEFWEHAYIKPTPPLVTPSKLTPTKTHSTKMIVYRNRINSHYNSASY